MSNLPQVIDEHQEKFLQVMENPEKFDRMKSLFISQVSANKKLQACSPASLMGALKKLAAYDLDLTDTNSAFLVPFGSEANLQIGYRGLQQIFYNKGGKKVFAETVFEDDDFEINLDEQRIVKHHPGKVRSEIAGFYAVAILSNGEQVIRYMSKTEMDEQRKKSRGDNYWKNGYRGMAEKTVIRKVLSKIPQAKITYIEANEVEIGQKEFGLESNAEIIEAETAELGLE
jgi:recombination protein RecT